MKRNRCIWVQFHRDWNMVEGHRQYSRFKLCSVKRVFMKDIVLSRGFILHVISIWEFILHIVSRCVLIPGVHPCSSTLSNFLANSHSAFTVKWGLPHL